MKAERHKKIVNLIKGHGAVKVSVLAKELSVTKETIRSDLNTLAEKGNKVDANNPQVSNYFGLAEYYPNG
ncbi:DeoR family transcriptional regulator, partial [Proteus mirabilis]